MNRCVLAASAVLLTAACGSTAPAAHSGAVVGQVLSAPSCPVERQAVPCPPRPVSNAKVVALRGGRVVAATSADARGRYRLTVSAGRCTVRATNTGGLATTAMKVVTVRADQVVYVRLVVDSGIR